MTASDSPQSVPDCPRREELSAFHVGKLTAPALEAIAAHLEACKACSSTLHALRDADDFLLSELRKPAQPEPFAAEATPVTARIEKLNFYLSARAGAPLQLAPEPAVEGQLGQYQLLERLGAGGMGQVFKARHLLMDRVVALKVIHRHYLDRPEAVLRFRREIQALARLDHPNIVRAEYADQAGDTHFLVMEYVEGTDLARLVAERGPLPVALACEVIRQAALGLQHAHEHGLVHRDLKPSNLLLVRSDRIHAAASARPHECGHYEPVQLKLLDLGIALIRHGHPGAEGVTATGDVIGTVDYMAPEQQEDSHAVDIRADLYSLGCTLYHLLTGGPPFSGPQYSSLRQKMNAHAEAPAPPIQQNRPDVPDGVAAVLDRLLAKDPARRYATPAELAGALQPFAAADVPPSGGVQPRRPDRRDELGGSSKDQRPFRRRLGLALAAVGLLVMATVAWKFVLPPGRPTSPGDVAQPGPSPEPDTVPVPEKLRIVSLRVRHFRDEPFRELGDLGVATFAARVHDDEVKVHARFSGPAYCFLIAFNPNGTERLCSPADETTRPPQAAALDYPPRETGYFHLTKDDGLGFQAFVLVASHEPLPSYKEWQARAGAAPWKTVQGDGVWRFDGEQLRLLGVERGKERDRPGAPKPLEELCSFFKDRPGIEAVQVLAFPVKEKK